MTRSKSNKEKLPIYISLFNLLAGVISLGMLGGWLWIWGVFSRLPGLSVGKVASFGSFEQFFVFVLGALVLAAIVFSNFYPAYKLVKTREISKKILALSLFGWVFFTSIFILIGVYFTLAGIWLAWVPILALVFTTALTLFLWKFSWRFASTALLLVVLSVVLSFAINFEEQYCWAKGSEAQALAQSRGEPIWDWPTEEEKTRDPGIEQIGIAYRAHMDCHKNFNFFSALKNELIP